MDFSERDDLASIRESAGLLAHAYDDDYWLDHDERKAFPWSFYNEFAKAGWIGIVIPEKYGGAGLGIVEASTLLRAVASARGLTEFAKADDIVILRTVNGQRFAGLYNITAIRRGLYMDPEIYANDLIVVGDSPQRRLFRDFIGVAPFLATPLVAILQ